VLSKARGAMLRSTAALTKRAPAARRPQVPAVEYVEGNVVEEWSGEALKPHCASSSWTHVTLVEQPETWGPAGSSDSAEAGAVSTVHHAAIRALPS
jgi:hypothetical protein